MSKVTKIISFIGLTIAMFMGTLDSTIVNIALPQIMTHFDASQLIQVGLPPSIR